MIRLAFAATLALVSVPLSAQAQDSTTYCDTFGFGVRCSTTTTPPRAPYVPTPLYVPQPQRQAEPSFTDLLILQSLQNRQSQTPAAKPVGREVFVNIQDYIVQGQCADAVYYARAFNDRTALDFALTCQPAK